MSTLTETELQRLGHTLENFGLAVPSLTLHVLSGGVTNTLYFGAITPAQEGVYATDRARQTISVLPMALWKAVNLEAGDFRRRTLFDLSTDEVRAFDLKRAKEAPRTFIRGAMGWRLGEQPVSAARVQDFLVALTGARVSSFVWPIGATNEVAQATMSLLASYGLDPENAVNVTLKAVDGRERTVAFGAVSAEQLIYASVQNGAAIVMVPAALGESAAQNDAYFTDSRIFPIEARTIAGFVLTMGEVTYSLTRKTEGGWRIESPVMAAANNVRVDEVLSRILTLKTEDVSESGDVAVALSSNAAPVKVSSERLFAGGDIRALRSLEVLSILPTDVRRIVSTSGAKGASPISLVPMTENAGWRVENGSSAVNTQAVQNILAACHPLKAMRVEQLKVSAAELDDYGLDKPFWTIALDSVRTDDVRRNILIGAETTGGRFVTVGSADAVFVISPEDVKKLTTPITP